jgi:hypothetical protein
VPAGEAIGVGLQTSPAVQVLTNGRRNCQQKLISFFYQIDLKQMKNCPALTTILLKLT